SDQVRGAIIAKTGTLISLDGGVSTLVGIAHTQNMGAVVFAVFNAGGSVYGYRQLQDKFVTEVIAEQGGGLPDGRLVDGVADYANESIVQNFNGPSPNGENPEHAGN